MTSRRVIKVSRTGSMVVNLLPLTLSTPGPSLDPAPAWAVVDRDTCTWFHASGQHGDIL